MAWRSYQFNSKYGPTGNTVYKNFDTQSKVRDNKIIVISFQNYALPNFYQINRMED